MNVPVPLLWTRWGAAFGAVLAVLVLSLMPMPDALAQPTGPSFTASNIHYTMEPTGTTSYGLTSVSFSLQASHPHDVTAWFNTSHPAADRIYHCAASGGTWICTAPSAGAEEDVAAADQLWVRVDDRVTKVLGIHYTRHPHPGSGPVGQSTSDGNLPFSGADIAAECAVALLAIAFGFALRLLGRRRRT